jgi:mannose-6-phosphate isomerase-like protein (cupin superfamily)
MRHKHLQFGHGFHVIFGNRHAQFAQMTIALGESEGDADNRHGGADQWLFVVRGTGVATITGERVELRAGTLLMIERGETHEIRNTGGEPLQTLNEYVPPAYTTSGNELPAAKP